MPSVVGRHIAHAVRCRAAARGVPPVRVTVKCTLVSFSKDPAVRWGLHDGDKTGALVVSAAVSEAPQYRLPRHLIADAPVQPRDH